MWMRTGTALHHLGVVAAGVVRGQEAEARASRGGEALDFTLDRDPGVRVDSDARVLPGLHVRELHVSLGFPVTQGCSGTSWTIGCPTDTIWPTSIVFFRGT